MKGEQNKPVNNFCLQFLMLVQVRTKYHTQITALKPIVLIACLAECQIVGSTEMLCIPSLTVIEIDRNLVSFSCGQIYAGSVCRGMSTGCCVWQKCCTEINKWDEGTKWNTLLSGSLATSVLVHYMCTEAPSGSEPSCTEWPVLHIKLTLQTMVGECILPLGMASSSYYFINCAWDLFWEISDQGQIVAISATLWQ